MINVPDSTSNNPLLSNRLTPVDPSQTQKPGQSPDANKQETEKQSSDQVLQSPVKQTTSGLYGANGRIVGKNQNVEPQADNKVEQGEKVTDGQKLANDIQKIKDSINSLDSVVNSGELEVMQSSYTQALNTSNDLTKSMNSFLLNI